MESYCQQTSRRTRTGRGKEIRQQKGEEREAGKGTKGKGAQRWGAWRENGKSEKASKRRERERERERDRERQRERRKAAYRSFVKLLFRRKLYFPSRWADRN
jgi:hypothetical protein